MDQVLEKLYQRVLCDIRTQCYIWQSITTATGYGKFRNKSAHRQVYSIVKGEIPEGYLIDHLCNTRNCINPDHLQLSTPKENGSRERAKHWNSQKTHCKRGHEYNEENTKYTMRKYGHDGWVLRTCKECMKIWAYNKKNGLSPKRQDVHTRLLSKVKINQDGCWEWQASKQLGYGKFKYEGVMQLAHRVSFRMFIGEFDQSLVVDHICYNKSCINPAHLQLLTLEENSKRGGKKILTDTSKDTIIN